MSLEGLVKVGCCLGLSLSIPFTVVNAKKGYERSVWSPEVSSEYVASADRYYGVAGVGFSSSILLTLLASSADRRSSRLKSSGYYDNYLSD